MGHRALIAYQRPDQGFVLHYSHWGAHDLELENRITEDTPLGGENDLEPAYLSGFTQALTEAVDGDTDVEGRMAQAQEATAVDREPIASSASISGVMDELDDAAYEAVFFVDPGTAPWTVRGYHVLKDLLGHRLLLGPEWSMDGERPKSLSYDRGWFRGVTDSHQSLLDDGVFDDRHGEGLEEAMNERVVRQAVERAADSMRKTIHPCSPALGDGPDRAAWWEEYPGAFVRMAGRSRVLGEMWPSVVCDHADFEHPDEFPDVKTADGERVSP